LLFLKDIYLLRQQKTPATTRVPSSPSRPLLKYCLVFLISFVILFLGMDRGFDYYDEGLILVGAMSVQAGQVPHRDFYANYGPGQFYTLAWLFDLFGRSVFAERIYDLIVRASIVTVVYGIAKYYCKGWIVACTTIACGFWLFSSGLPTLSYPIVPILLISLVSSILLLQAFEREAAWPRMAAAGALTGLAALFRYDVGAALALAQTCSIGIAALSSPSRRKGRWRATVLPYWLGIALLFMPAALLYMAVAPLHPFIHDIILFPTQYYVRARRFPFPGVHWRSLENIALYLPIPVGALSFCSLFAGRAQDGNSVVDAEGFKKTQSQRRLLILFGLLTVLFYFKGVVRISVVQMLLALVPMLITLAVLYDYTSRRGQWLYRAAQAAMVLSIFAATWSAFKQVRLLYLNHPSVLQEVLSPPGPAAIRSETDWCGVPNPLHTGLCFLVNPDHAKLIQYIVQRTNPGERIFIGLTRHDRIVSNDLLTYFATSRLPATHWAHFDPDLQTRADVQAEMIRELGSQRVRYVVLESEFDSTIEPSNDSSKSSGVTLLDDYIRQNYRQVETFGPLSVWLLKGAQP
jgi:4-amino-4-deoxy-L-arabinose transferase-like glycosyltransferase